MKVYDLTKKQDIVQKLYSMCEQAARTKKITYYWYEKKVKNE